LNIEFCDLPALLNPIAGTCGTDRQCGFHNQQGQALTTELFNRVNNLVLEKKNLAVEH
jgi:hypothetical protein